MRHVPASIVSRSTSVEAVCIGCGCGDSHACEHPVTGPCWWIKVDYSLGIGVCSECPEKIEEFEDRVLKSRGQEQTGSRPDLSGRRGDHD